MQKFYAVAALFILPFFVKAQTPCTDGFAGVYPCRNMDLMAFMSNEEIGGDANTNTNDIWGWVSPVTGKEYALVGCSNGTAFVNISDPVEPIYLGLLPTHTVNSLWRDLESYNNYCFIVSEASGHGLQVFDLMQLDAVSNPPVAFEESAFYDGFGHCHTLNINQESGYLYANGTGTYDGGLHIVDINDPLNPTLAGGFANGGYTHDCFVWTYDGPDPDWQGEELVFACNEDDLMIVNVTDKTDCYSIGSYDYNGEAPVGYIHQGWITKDKSHFLIDDELDEIQVGNDQLPYGTRTHMFDITNLDDLVYQGFYEGASTSIDHNLYVLDQFVYESNYRSGVRVLDAINVDDAELHEVGYFDLYPTNDFAQFNGTWSNYPYFPSGLVAATSMDEGFFIIKPKLIVLSQDNWTLCGGDDIIFDVQINAQLAFPLTFAVSGLGASSVAANPTNEMGTSTVAISGLSQLPSGTYAAKLLLQSNFGEQYEVPFSVTISNNLANAPVLIDVPDNSMVSNTDEATLFSWTSIENADSYIYHLASDEAFTSLIEIQNTVNTNYLMTFDLPDGTYYWRVRASNGCGDGNWSEVFSFTVGFVGVNESEIGRLSIYPNPADQNLQIKYSSPIESIFIKDLSGRIVEQFGTTNQFNQTLNIAPLASGIYLLEVNGAVARFIKK